MVTLERERKVAIGESILFDHQPNLKKDMHVNLQDTKEISSYSVQHVIGFLLFFCITKKVY